MDIHLEPSESISVSIKGDPDTVYHLNAELIKQMGKAMVDGLMPDEIAQLEKRRKFYAVKSVRLRTGKNLADAKKVVDTYCEKHGCCVNWPSCEKCKPKDETKLDTSRLTVEPYGTQAVTFSYAVKISKKKAQELQEHVGYDIKTYGFYSFVAKAGLTKWSCKAKKKEPSIK